MLKSICCEARPFEVTSIKEMEGTCNECMKPTLFKDVDAVTPPAYDSFLGMWDCFIDFCMSTDNITEDEDENK